MPKNESSSSERRAPGSLSPFCPLVVLLFLTFSIPSAAQIPPATVEMTFVAGGGFAPNQTISLIANVTLGGAAVTTGTITFYEGQGVIATTSVNPHGSTSLNTALPPGGYIFSAHYNGSAQAGAAWTPQEPPITIPGTAQLALGVSGNSEPYTLTAKLITNLAQGATGGQIVFVDQTSGQTLGIADMDQTTYQYQSRVDMTGPVGDFNGDGRADFVNTTTLPNGQFAYLVNLANASGTYSQVTSQPFGASTDACPILAVGDFNNDGMSDLVVQDETTHVVSVLLSQGNGQFTVAGQMTIPVLVGVVAGDFNNDGNLDVVIAGTNGLQFFAGDGAGHLAAAQSFNASGVAVPSLISDYNLDGNLDLVSYNPANVNSYAGTNVYLGTANDASFTEEPQSVFGGYPPPANVQSIITSDFNGDGIPDIAYATSTTVTVLVGDGRGNFFPPNGITPYQIGTHSVVQLATADVNADGYPDIVAFVQDESSSGGAPVPWNMIVLAGEGFGTFNLSPEAASDSSGTRFPNPPIAFAFPTIGEALTTQAPISTIYPFLAQESSVEISATLTGVTLPPGPPHTIVATYNGPEFSNSVLPAITSNSIQLSGGNGSGGIYYTQGFTSGSITTNGAAVVSNNALQLTDGNPNEAASAFVPTLENVQSFATTFYFQLSNAQADGFTFTLQNAAPQALGGTGGSLGYAGIPKSFALKFDLFNNAGEGSDSIGVFTNGATPTIPATDMSSSNVDLHSGDLMQAQLIYDGKNLHVTVTDTANEQSFQQTYAIDIPGAIGSPTAYAGFTAATGGLSATQVITAWTYAALPYYPNFSGGPAMLLNGGAVIRGTTLHMIDSGIANEARSAWYPTPVPVQEFTCDFTFNASNAIADGLTFTIQNAGPTIFGQSGGGLGYGAGDPGGAGGIPNSVAIKFDLFSNNGEGNDSTGIYYNGASPTTPAIDLSSTGINLHSEDPINAHMVYDGTTLTVTLLDTVTKATATQTYSPVNIPPAVGGSIAYVGFTAGTGALSASEDIDGWTYLPTTSITSPVTTY